MGEAGEVAELVEGLLEEALAEAGEKGRLFGEECAEADEGTGPPRVASPKTQSRPGAGSRAAVTPRVQLVVAGEGEEARRGGRRRRSGPAGSVAPVEVEGRCEGDGKVEVGVQVGGEPVEQLTGRREGAEGDEAQEGGGHSERP